MKKNKDNSNCFRNINSINLCNDPDSKISFGYLTNKLGGEYLINNRAQSLIDAVYNGKY